MMNTALWVIQGFLCIIFMYASLSKLFQTKEQQVKTFPQMSHIGATTIKWIGLVELLGAIGIIVPMLTGILPILMPIAAVGLSINMLCASVFLASVRNYKAILFTALLMCLAVLVAYGRF